MVNQSQFISQYGFPQDGDVKHPTSSIEALLEETISGEWGTDCADASGTRVIRTTNFTNDGVLNLDDVVLRSIDQKKVEKKQLHKGDIILEKSGGTKDNPVGRLVYFAEDGIYLANNFTQVLRPSNSVNSRYLFAALYYLYQTHKPLIKGLGNQTNGIQNLKVPQYLQLQVCVPDRKEQDAFEQVMQRADKSKFAGFKSQFIELVQRCNPEKKTLESICTRGPQNGFYRKGAEIDGTIPIVKMSQLFGFESMSDVSHFDLVSMTEDEIRRFSLTENDLLFGRRSLVPEGAGKCRRAGKIDKTVVFESSILRVSIDPAICYPRFIQAWTESPEGEQAISELRAGTSVVGITGSGLSKVIIPVPTKSVQDVFIGVAEQADKSKYLN